MLARDATPVACGFSGDGFPYTCFVERNATDQGVVLTVHHPDGGFRKLRLVQDGTGLIAADGAERARVSVIDAVTISVAIGNARYRLPATIGPVEPQ